MEFVKYSGKTDEEVAVISIWSKFFIIANVDASTVGRIFEINIGMISTKASTVIRMKMQHHLLVRHYSSQQFQLVTPVSAIPIWRDHFLP